MPLTKIMWVQWWCLSQQDLIKLYCENCHRAILTVFYYVSLSSVDTKNWSTKSLQHSCVEPDSAGCFPSDAWYWPWGPLWVNKSACSPVQCLIASISNTLLSLLSLWSYLFYIIAKKKKCSLFLFELFWKFINCPWAQLFTNDLLTYLF